MPGFTNIQVYPFLPLAGGTMTGGINMNSQNITNGGDISAANANGYKLINQASSSTAATLVPNRGNTGFGLGGDSGSNTSLVVSNTSAISAASTSMTLTQTSFGYLFNAASGAALVSNYATTLLSGLSGATVTATNLIPAGSIVFGVVARVTTLITGASSFKIGDGTTNNLWWNTVALTSGTTTGCADFLSTFKPTLYTAATSVVLTANTSNFTAGAVRLVVYYQTYGAPTS